MNVCLSYKSANMLVMVKQRQNLRANIRISSTFERSFSSSGCGGSTGNGCEQ